MSDADTGRRTARLDALTDPQRALLLAFIAGADPGLVDRFLAVVEQPDGAAPEAVVAAWCKGCRHATRSVPCPRCGGPSCAACGRCPACDGPLPEDDND